jgi:hypothetical protein
MDEGAWRARLGDRYDVWAKARRTYDPDGVFRSALIPHHRQRVGSCSCC